MKKIIVCGLNNKDTIGIVNGKLNSLIRFDTLNNKYFFKSHYPFNEEQLDFEIFLLTNNYFNERMFDLMKNIARKSLSDAENISNELIESGENSNLSTPMWTTIYKFSHGSINNLDIFDFFTDIFIYYLNGHYLKNGNKRLAFMILINTTYVFGWYFTFSVGEYKNFSKHKNIIEEFTKKLENQAGEILSRSNIVRKEIKDWITSNLVVGCNFRQNKIEIKEVGSMKRQQKLLEEFYSADSIKKILDSVLKQKNAKYIKAIIRDLENK